MIALEQ